MIFEEVKERSLPEALAEWVKKHPHRSRVANGMRGSDLFGLRSLAAPELLCEPDDFGDPDMAGAYYAQWIASQALAGAQGGGDAFFHRAIGQMFVLFHLRLCWNDVERDLHARVGECWVGVGYRVR